MSSENEDSLPDIGDHDSPGSSVSSSLQREYEELLKYAVVTPKVQVPESVYTTNSFLKKDESSESKSSSSLTTTNSTQSTYSEDMSRVAREDVKLLPSTPASRVTFQGEGSVARDSLLRNGESTRLFL